MRRGCLASLGSLDNNNFASWRAMVISLMLSRFSIAISGSPDWRVPKNAPGPRRARSASAMAKPLFSLANASSRALIAPDDLMVCPPELSARTECWWGRRKQ